MTEREILDDYPELEQDDFPVLRRDAIWITEFAADPSLGFILLDRQ